MPDRLKDPSRTPDHVLITGASSGLGKAMAEQYAVPGRTLSLAGRNEPRMSEIAAACRDSGATTQTICIDVTDDEAMQQWIVERDSALPIDILIANAGVGGAAVVPSSSGESGPLARQILAINTVGVINTVTPVLSRMTDRGSGHIVMVGSIQSSIGLPQSPVYCASKAAVQIYADALRRLLADRGVIVTLVLPGFIDTPMSRSLDMPRPWVWSADRAARRVIADIAKRARLSVFPWPIRLAIALQNYAPVWVVDAVLKQSTRLGWANKQDAD